MERVTTGLDLDDMVVFARVVRAGSFTRAAAALGMPKSTVSRRVAELEKRIGARLLQRTTRASSLTDAGRVYFEHCARIVAAVEEANLAVHRLQASPSGLLRVSAPLAFSVLGPVIAEMLRLYPDVTIELVCTDRRVDLVEERVDLAIRAGRPEDSTLIARKLGTIRRSVYASPAVAARLGKGSSPSDLGLHDCAVFAPEGGAFSLQSGKKPVEVEVVPRFAVNDYDVLRSVVRAGYGVALMPDIVCEEDVREKRLRRVLPAWDGPSVPVFAIYPSARQVSPKLTAFLELLTTRLGLPDARK